MTGEMAAWWVVGVLGLWLTSRVSGQNQNNFAEEIPGEAGLDYPTLTNVPDTPFSCLNRVNGGYYADLDTGCQVFHVCGSASAIFGSVTYSFLCPNGYYSSIQSLVQFYLNHLCAGTVFNQKYFTCDWWYNVDCGASQDFYDLNNQLGITPGPNKNQQFQKPATPAPEFGPLPTYGNRKNRKQRNKGKTKPVRVQINKEAELFPFPNFPSENQRARSRRKDVDILTKQKSFLTLNERFPRRFDLDFVDDEDDNMKEDGDYDYQNYNYIENPIFD